MLGIVVVGLLVKLRLWLRGWFGIGGGGGIVLELMGTADDRLVVVSSNLFKGECRVGLFTGICQTRFLLNQLICCFEGGSYD